MHDMHIGLAKLLRNDREVFRIVGISRKKGKCSYARTDYVFSMFKLSFGLYFSCESDKKPPLFSKDYVFSGYIYLTAH